MRHGGRENYILTQILPLAMTFLKCVALLLNCVQLFFLIFFNFFLFVVNFVIHWNETAMGLHVFPIPITPSHLPLHPLPLGLTLLYPMDCSPPDSSVHRISQARILKWLAISFSRGSSWPGDQNLISCISKGILYHWAKYMKLLEGALLSEAHLSILIS